MRRRFAGEVLGGQAAPADTLTAATEALKQTQVSPKGARGGRLGPGSQIEREEGAKAAPILAAAKAAETPKAPAVDIAGLRSALGIDQLMSSIRGLQSLGETSQADQFEFPSFEMPQFEMPAFELPDFEKLLSAYLPKQETDTTDTTSTTTTTTTTGVQTPATKKNVVKIAGQNINLAKFGGAGFSKADIKALEKKGLSTQQIIKAASQSATAPTAAAQKALNIKAVAKPEGGFTVQRQSDKKPQNKPALVLASPSAVAQTQAPATQTKQMMSSAKLQQAAPTFAGFPAPTPSPRSNPAPTPAPAPAPAPAQAPKAASSGSDNKGSGRGSSGDNKGGSGKKK